MRSKLKWIFTLLVAFFIQVSFAQEKTITGTVTDANGPLYGANVVVKGASKGVSTGFDGKYSIKAKEGDILVFSFMGMNDVIKTVGSSNVINTFLQDESKKLIEVVVVGYGTQKKKDLTSSVAKIKGDDIKTLVTPSFESQLAGRASGVQVTTATGVVGAPTTVRIRGLNSISSGTGPLYVVDGIPMYSGDVGGLANANGLGDINPNDIESFEILKDGAATAIYGSRGANGVILITTKKGKKGSMKVSFNTVAGFASAAKKFDLLGTSDFLVIANEKRTNRGQAPWAIGNTYDTDWQSVVLKDAALQTDHNLSLNGGTEKTKYFLSLGYTTQEGIAKANEMTRYTFRTNLEHDVTKWLTVGGNLGLTRTRYFGLNTGRNSLSGNMFNVIRQLPNVPVYDASNPTGYNLTLPLTANTVGQGTNTDPVGDQISNIAYVLDNNKQESKIQRYILGAYAQVNFNKDFNYKLQVSVDNPITKGFQYQNPVHGDGRSANGTLQNDNTDLLRWNIQNILNYNKTFADAHNISATAVLEQQKERNEYFYGYGSNLLDQFYNQNLVTGSYGTQQSGGSVTEIGFISYLARLSYNYKQKYYIQGSFRRDGLSKFAADKRWYNFPGVSAGWNVAKESFMGNLSNKINDFKLRGSYSKTGNVDVPGGSYPYLSYTSPSQYGALNGIGYTQFGNNELTWESSTKVDYGVDLSLLNEKVQFTFDYFKNDIDGMVLRVQTPPSLGIPNNNIVKNIGNMYNQGLEFSLTYNVMNKKNFQWTINSNITFQKSVVTNLPNHADINGGSAVDDTNIGPNIIIREGESPNSIYGFEYWGVNPANGAPVYYKADGSLVQGVSSGSGGNYFVFDPNNPSDASTPSTLNATTDKRILGNTLPKYFGSFSTKFTYKNFDLGFLLRFSGGNKIFNATRRDLMNQNLNNNSTEILGRWQSPSNPGDGWTPILWASNNTFLNQSSNASSRFVEDGDFINLDNISIGYNFPKSLIEKIKVDNVRIFVQGQNLLLITKYKGLNPEMETYGVDLNGTPRAKVFSVGLNLNL